MPESPPDLPTLLSEDRTKRAKVLRDVDRSLDLLDVMIKKGHVCFDTSEHHDLLYQDLLSEAKELVGQLAEGKDSVDRDKIVQLNDQLETLFMPLVNRTPEGHQDYIHKTARQEVIRYLKEEFSISESLVKVGAPVGMTLIAVANAAHAIDVVLGFPNEMAGETLAQTSLSSVFIGTVAYAMKKSHEHYENAKGSAAENTLVRGSGLTGEFLVSSRSRRESQSFSR